VLNKEQIKTKLKTTIMKHIITTAILAVIAMMTACNSSEDFKGETSESWNEPVRMTFAISGDFTLTTSDFTRALTSDGKDMTDVWVLDYQSGSLVQQLHQSDNTADDFGMPTLDLSLGTHHLYFIASRSTSPVLNTEAHTLTFGKILDTFWKDYEITITGGTSSGNRAVALDRITTRLKVTFSDAIPTGAALFNITPATWYYGFNYQTGNPTTATNSQNVVVNIPSESIGQTGVFLSVYGFSSTTEWTTDIALNCKASNNDVLGSATIENAPFLRNRSSDYTGLLFTDNGGWTLSLNTTWDDSYQGTW
jgi:hypothetical protein